MWERRWTVTATSVELKVEWAATKGQVRLQKWTRASAARHSQSLDIGRTPPAIVQATVSKNQFHSAIQGIIEPVVGKYDLTRITLMYLKKIYDENFGLMSLFVLFIRRTKFKPIDMSRVKDETTLLAINPTRPSLAVGFSSLKVVTGSPHCHKKRFQVNNDNLKAAAD
ncbi:hypothetical protein BU17DRAFT_69421 [Hysterangium stoloniferum]|nr:hypothetical protein BU17DRAFT_69421 [Hysterangium stoloniferum]